MVVLASAGVANNGSEELAQKLHVSYDQYHFFAEAHPKLKPVETNTAGIFLAGACQAPKDIPESVAAASGAAAKVIGLFSNSELTREPVVAKVKRTPAPPFSSCMGCFMCKEICPYQAIDKEEIKDRSGKVVKTIAHINPGLCQGCGTCVAFCRSKSIDRAYTHVDRAPREAKERGHQGHENPGVDRIEEDLEYRVEGYEARAVFRVSPRELVPNDNHRDASGEAYHDEADHVLGLVPQLLHSV